MTAAITLKRLAYDDRRKKYYLEAESSTLINKNIYPRHMSVQALPATS
jgi:hypothetical protein